MPTRKPARSKRPARKPARMARKPRPAKKAVARRPKARRAPETLRLRTFTPSLTVGDLERSLAFYTRALGFIVGERWMDGKVLQGVMLKAGACELGLSQDDWAKGRDRKKGEGFRVWCRTVQDIDALASRVKTAGFTLTEEPKDEPWGSRAFSLDDPDGFHLTIYREA